MSKSKKPSGWEAPAPSREQRAAMLLQVQCTLADDVSFPIRVRNLSSQGLGGLCLQKVDLGEGEAVEIVFRNVAPISAQVMWFKDGEIGIRFDKPADLEHIAEARTWVGLDFEMKANHAIAKRCYRPGVKI